MARRRGKHLLFRVSNHGIYDYIFFSFFSLPIFHMVFFFLSFLSTSTRFLDLNLSDLGAEDWFLLLFVYDGMDRYDWSQAYEGWRSGFFFSSFLIDSVVLLCSHHSHHSRHRFSFSLLCCCFNLCLRTLTENQDPHVFWFLIPTGGG